MGACAGRLAAEIAAFDKVGPRDHNGEEKAKLDLAAPARKIALEELLRQRRLVSEGPVLRGERRRSPLSTGHAGLDARLGGGLPRGQLSEAVGPASSGRTGLCLAVTARVTSAGGLAAWLDPLDRFDPASAAAAGIELKRLLWLRGAPGASRPAADATRALVTLVGSGLFDLVVLDLAGLPAVELQRLPATTWIRVQRALEGRDAALLLLAAQHVAKSPQGAQLEFAAAAARFEGQGSGRLLVALRAAVRPGPLALRGEALELPAAPPPR